MGKNAVKIEMSDDVVRSLIEKIKALPHLWNPTNPEYKNRNKKKRQLL